MGVQLLCFFANKKADSYSWSEEKWKVLSNSDSLIDKWVNTKQMSTDLVKYLEMFKALESSEVIKSYADTIIPLTKK